MPRICLMKDCITAGSIREYLNYVKNYHLLKESENYKMLNSNMAQQILKEVDGCFQIGRAHV